MKFDIVVDHRQPDVDLSIDAVIEESPEYRTRIEYEYRCAEYEYGHGHEANGNISITG